MSLLQRLTFCAEAASSHFSQLKQQEQAHCTNSHTVQLLDCPARCTDNVHKSTSTTPTHAALAANGNSGSLSRFSLFVPIRCDDWQAEGLNPKLHSKQKMVVYLNRSLPTSQGKQVSVAIPANSSIKKDLPLIPGLKLQWKYLEKVLRSI